MEYGIKKKVIYTFLIAAMFFGLIAIAVWGIGEKGSGSAKDIKLGLDLAGGVSITYEVVSDNPSAQEMADTVYKLQKRVEGKSTEAEVYQEGSNRINVEIPGVKDANAILKELGTPGSLEFLDESGYAAWKAKKEYTPLLTGSDVKTAEALIDTTKTTGKYCVELHFTEEGTKKFATATSKNLNKAIYIVYDGKVVSAPTVKQAITGGEAIIDSIRTYEEADSLATYVRIGSIPLELKEVRSNVVGAKLGEEAISTSLFAGAIGLIVLAIFMIVIYRVLGVVATISLVIYTGLMLFLISVYEITLTLPGIAGIILGIGMAVDANVIIYSRIREEIGAGNSVPEAVKTGFTKARSAILDGNITTLIAALVLGFMGSGTVKGFAITLGLGVVVSMFTALVVSYVIMKLLINFGATNPKLYGKTVHKKTINFLSKKNICFVLSVVVILAGVAVMAVNSSAGKGMFNYSLDFVGGTSTTVTFNEEMTREDVDKKVIPVIAKTIGDNNVQQQIVTGTKQVVFKTMELDLEAREKLNDALNKEFGVDKSLITAENISAAVSSEMQKDAIVSVVVATICMLIYIWFRFSDIRFAASAVMALIHDVLIVLGFYAVARLSVGNTFIACMLTVVGYSINATIIIFDRIREVLRDKGPNADLKEVVNSSITFTLSRTLNTTVTTLIMLIALCIFGVATIREFTLPLVVGLLCGVYSSVCITGALWYVLRKVFVKKIEE